MSNYTLEEARKQRDSYFAAMNKAWKSNDYEVSAELGIEYQAWVDRVIAMEQTTLTATESADEMGPAQSDPR